MESDIFTNELFMIFLSLLYLMIAIREGPIHMYVKYHDIMQMNSLYSATLNMNHFVSPGLIGVELLWSVVLIAHAVLNILLLFAIAIGWGPFKLLLRPGLVYLELVTNASLLFGRMLACYASNSDPSKLACVIFSATKIIGLAVVIYRWWTVFRLWRMNDPPNEPIITLKISPLARKSKIPKVKSFHRASPSIHTMENHRTNIEKVVRRRLAKTMATESKVRTQILIPTRNKMRSICDEESKICRRSQSQSSLLNAIATRDWEHEFRAETPMKRREPQVFKPTSRSVRFKDSPPEKEIEENGKMESELKDLRDIRRIVCLSMVPESVIYSWLQNLPMKRVKEQDFYDDWKRLLSDEMTSNVHSRPNDIYEEYNKLHKLCEKGMEFRGGTRISQSSTQLDCEDLSFDSGKIEDVLMEELPSKMAAEELGLKPKRAGKGNPGSGSVIKSVESEMFANLADRVLLEANKLKLRAANSSNEIVNEDKSVQVNTLPEDVIQKYMKLRNKKGSKENGGEVDDDVDDAANPNDNATSIICETEYSSCHKVTRVVKITKL